MILFSFILWHVSASVLVYGTPLFAHYLSCIIRCHLCSGIIDYHSTHSPALVALRRIHLQQGGVLSLCSL